MEASLTPSSSIGGKFKLPDIDSTGKDTFETAESKGELLKDNVDIISEIPNENIEKNTILPTEAFKKICR